MKKRVCIKIYHNKNFSKAHFDSNSFPVSMKKAVLLGRYLYGIKKEDLELIAEIDTDDLEQGFALSQNVTDSWVLDSRVKAFKNEARSTFVGDVLEKDNTFYLVDYLGFTEVELK